MKQEERAVFTLRKLYQTYGYSQFKMRKFEPYDLYMQNKDFLVSDGIITFTDTDGTLMALKPDVTLSIVKNYRNENHPIQKVYYNENVYRIAGAGKTFREIMQTGLECMGFVSLYDICEVILLAAKSLASISPNFVLDISHMQIMQDAIDALSLPYETKKSVLNAICEKNFDALAPYPSLQKLIGISGAARDVFPALQEYCTTEASCEAFQQLQTIEALLRQNGFADVLQLDFSIVNDMDYYNGIVFRGYIEGIPSGVLAGGQYNKLMKKMGKNADGIGFAVYLDQLERLDPPVLKYDADVVILYQKHDDVLDLSAKCDRYIKSGKTVLLLQQIPQSLRFKELLRYENGRIEIIENHG